MEVCPFVGTNGLPVAQPTTDQQRLATLSYLCEANGHILPPPVVFNWNWVEPNESADYHGVVSINKTAFVAFLKNELLPYVEGQCYAPKARVWAEGLLVYFDASVTPRQSPTIVAHDSGETVLSFSYSSSAADSLGAQGMLAWLQLSPSFNLDVKFSGNTITIEQHLVLYMCIRALYTEAKGNIVDKTITDTYTLSVTAQGGLTAKLAATPADHSVKINVDAFANFFGGNINDNIDYVVSQTANLISPDFRDIPLTLVQDFVFPGGRTFAFKNIAFSDYQDLVSHITYADPTFF
jgi:hypothetical protein